MKQKKLNGVQSNFGTYYNVTGWHWYESDEEACRVDGAFKFPGERHIYYHVVESKNNVPLGWFADYDESDEPMVAESEQLAELQYKEFDAKWLAEKKKREIELVEQLKDIDSSDVKRILEAVLGEDYKVLSRFEYKLLEEGSNILQILRERGVLIGREFVPLRMISRVVGEPYSAIETVDGKSYRVSKVVGKAVIYTLGLLR